MHHATFLFSCGALALTCSLAPADEPKKPAGEPPRRPNLERMLEQNDKNKDGFIDRSEAPEQLKRRFDELDTNKDGKLSREELEKGMANRPGGAPGRGTVPPETFDSLFDLLDTNKDGKLSRAELQNAVKLVDRHDSNKDGTLDRTELAAAVALANKREYVAPAARSERKQDALKVGDLAPEFTLPTLDGKKEVKLSSFRGKQPVVLVFASYT